MNELIKITEKDGDQLINARDLHESLQVGRDFSTWVKDRIEKYGFVEGEDFFVYGDFCSPNLRSKKARRFSPNLGKTSYEQNLGGRPSIEYFLTLDMAKELAMVENNEAGREIRRYLIKVEKKFREIAISGKSPMHTELKNELSEIRKALTDIKKGQLQISAQPEITDPKTAMLYFGGKFLEITGKDGNYVEVQTLFKIFKGMFKVEIDSHKFMYELPLAFPEIRLDTRRKYKALFRGCMIK